MDDVLSVFVDKKCLVIAGVNAINPILEFGTFRVGFR